MLFLFLLLAPFFCFGFINGDFSQPLYTGWVIESGTPVISKGILRMNGTSVVHQDFVFTAKQHHLTMDITGTSTDKNGLLIISIVEPRTNVLLVTLLKTLFEFNPVNDLPFISIYHDLEDDEQLMGHVGRPLRLHFEVVGKKTFMFIDNVELKK